MTGAAPIHGYQIPSFTDISMCGKTRARARAHTLPPPLNTPPGASAAAASTHPSQSRPTAAFSSGTTLHASQLQLGQETAPTSSICSVLHTRALARTPSHTHPAASTSSHHLPGPSTLYPTCLHTLLEAPCCCCKTGRCTSALLASQPLKPKCGFEYLMFHLKASSFPANRVRALTRILFAQVVALCNQ